MTDSSALAPEPRGAPDDPNRPATIRQSRARNAVAEAATGVPKLAAVLILSMIVPISLALGGLALSPTRLLLLACFLPLLAAFFFGSSGRMRPMDIFVLLASGWAVLALVMSDPSARVVEPAGIFLLEFLGSYLVGRVAIRNASEFRYMIGCYIVVVLLMLPFALYEGLTHTNLFNQLIPLNRLPSDYSVRLGVRRVNAVFLTPIHYGAFVSAGLALFIYAANRHASAGRRVFLAFVVLLSTFLSLSTGALIATVIQVAVIVWDVATRGQHKRWTTLVWIITIFYVLIDVFSDRTPFHILAQYGSFNATSAYNRIIIWDNGMNNVMANPLFGLGQFVEDWERPTWLRSSVDNFWLLLTMTYGIPFILLFGAAIATLVSRLSLARFDDADVEASRIGYLITFLALCIAGGTVHYWGVMLAFFMFLFGAGAWMLDHDRGDGASPKRTRAAHRRLRQARLRKSRQLGPEEPMPEEVAAPAGPATPRGASRRKPYRRDHH